MEYRRNRECKDIRNNDLFGMKSKYTVMYEFIINLPFDDEFKCHQMIALYGEWGSGKSSFFESFKKDSNHDNNCKNKILIFDAWEIEDDDNLETSLLDFIFYKLKTEDISEEIKKNMRGCKSFLRAIAASSTFDFKLFQIDVAKAMEEVKTIEEENKIGKSFYTEKDEFVKMFEKITDELISNYGKTHLTICIDELDRCSPEKVIKLLTNIKHFYTLNPNITFVCGVDREAIKKALQCRYNDILKADEYLEKIFDMSFTIPNMIDMEKLVNYYIEEPIIRKNVMNFLHKLKFNNPRKLKKALNKYSTYCKLNDFAQNVIHENIDTEMKKNIKYFHKKNAGLEVVFVLYSIILHEFYPKKFEKIYNINEKIKSIESNQKESVAQKTSELKLMNELFSEHAIAAPLKIDNKIEDTFISKIAHLNSESVEYKNNKQRLVMPFIICLFAPNITDEITLNNGAYDFYPGNTSNVLGALELQIRMHEQNNDTNNIQLNFCKYLLEISNTERNFMYVEEAFSLKDLFDTTKFLL